MKKVIFAMCLLVIPFITQGSFAQTPDYSSNTMAAHPEWYIKVTDWNVYATWSAVAIIHHVTIENNSDIEYKDVQEVGVLPVTLPPRSKNTYLKSGHTLGAASTFMNPLDLQVLTATPVLN